MNNINEQDPKEPNREEHEEPEQGRPIFYNFWGRNFSKWALILILLIFLAMISLRMCDSPYVVPGDPDAIKIID